MRTSRAFKGKPLQPKADAQLLSGEELVLCISSMPLHLAVADPLEVGHFHWTAFLIAKHGLEPPRAFASNKEFYETRNI
eukprot:2106422-Amphidinium_carterae.2